jgi:hypothetical protein
MRILLEEHKYAVTDDLKKILCGIGLDAMQDIQGNVSLSYVGYFYNPEINDCVFILPKVLMDDNDRVFADNSENGITPEDLLQIDPKNTKLSDKEQSFLYEFAVWIYRAIAVFQNTHKDSNIIYHKQISQIGQGLKRRTNTFLDILLSLIQFNRDHQDFITFTLKNIHSGYNKINWTRTISRSQAIIQDGSPIYLNPVNKKRQINFDEELLIIYYSILNHICDKYGFKVNINVGFPLIKGAQFESYLNGRGKRRLLQIKYKYYSDIALELWNLCYAFFNHSQNITATIDLKEFLLVKNFHIVFEAIIDELLGSNHEKHELEKELIEQRDGKIIDHLFTHEGLIQSNDETELTYYIGDSKYYKIGHSLGDTSIYKQYTYARNIIQYNVSLWMDETKPNPNVKVRDDQTEGYNILPNFFISADMEKGDYSYAHREIKRIGEPEINFQFHDRLFDRDTLLLSRYNVNFLFIIALYARNKQAEKQTWQSEVRNQFRKEIRQLLNDKYDFYAMKGIGNPLSGEQFITEHFKELQGKLFRPFDDKNLYTLALEKKQYAGNTQNAEAYQLLKNFFIIEKVNLGDNPKTQLEKRVADYQAAHPYQPVPTDWLPQYYVERYVDNYFVIGLYHDQAHWDWITGKNDRGSLIYNVRLGNRDGAIPESRIRAMKPKFVILYEQNHLHENKYHVFRVHDYAKMSKERMQLALYPNPKGDYFIFRMDEEVSIGAFDINQAVNEYMIDHKLEPKGQPIYLTGKELLKYKQ